MSILFRGRPALGVVWEIKEGESKDLESVQAIHTANPLLTQIHRRFIEYLSLTGVCSFSTALHQWLPSALRSTHLTLTTTKLIADYDQAGLSHVPRQLAVCVPGDRPQLRAELSKKFGKRFLPFFQRNSVTPNQELQQWLGIAKGEYRVVMARERALFAPWRNLRQISVFEPEDIFYYHEQLPYLQLTEAAQELAKLSRAKAEYRSYLPTPAAQIIWDHQVQGVDNQPPVEWIDLKKEPILNPYLIRSIQETVAKGEKVLILYNAHDRIRPLDNDEPGSKLVHGIEFLAKQLARELDVIALPEEIIIGTRSIFNQRYEQVGLCVILSLDPLLGTESSGDLIHGWSDLGHLFHYNVPCIFQTHELYHPLVQAIQQQRFVSYLVQTLQSKQQNNLPPFGQHYFCSLPFNPEMNDGISKLREQIASNLEKVGWEVSHPLTVKDDGRESYGLLLHSSEPQKLLPIQTRKILAALPRPWKIRHNPWHVL